MEHTKDRFISKSLTNADFKRDYDLGLKSEIEILPIITNYFKRNILHMLDNYSKYDYIDDKGYTYELKTRNNTYNNYSTTMIGADKLEDKMIYLFKFTDGLYFIEYHDELFKTFLRKPFVRQRGTYTMDIKKDYIYIPIKHLIKINLL